MPRYGMAFPPNNRVWYERPIGTGYALSLAGGTMEGPMYLWREPRYPTEAASKAYVDFAVGNTGGWHYTDRSGAFVMVQRRWFDRVIRRLDELEKQVKELGVPDQAAIETAVGQAIDALMPTLDERYVRRA